MDHYPKPRRRRSGRLWAGVLLAMLAVGGIGYLLYEDLTRGSAGDVPPTPGMTSPAPAAPAPVTPPRRDTILTCTAVDGTVFYTNASRCEEADLENRVNVLPAYEPPRPERRDCLGAQEGGFRPQSFLAACQEPFNQALELETLLLESDDPAASSTGRRYCAFIVEGVQAGCMATSDQFCFLHICQELQAGGGS